MAKQKQKEFRAPRGTHDILPEEQRLRELIEKEAKALASFYGFERIDTPHFEATDLFVVGSGETTDIVARQMYSFRTRGGDQLTLRPEGTPAVMRAFFEHGMLSLPQPVKLYYLGPFFRHESPQRGRFRELHQWGLEILGEGDPVADAQIVQVCSVFLRELGITGATIEVNSIGCAACRPHYRSELSAYYRSKIKGLCADCKERFRLNPLRLLDCKEEKCRTARQGSPQVLSHLCDACKNHLKLFLEFLDEAQISYTLNPYLVRGLDYYTRTVFEIFVDDAAAPLKINEASSSQEVAKGNKDNVILSHNDASQGALESEDRRLALAGGGRYDNLGELIGGRPVPAVGVAIGIERVMLAWRLQGLDLPKLAPPKVFLSQLGELARKKSLPLMETLRKANITVAESLGRDSIKSQLKIADKLGVEYALILGQKEALDKTVIIREMSSGNQEIVPQEKLIETLKKRLKR